ncbi:unnamed protein product, partial [Laminaria digitata]
VHLPVCAVLHVEIAVHIFCCLTALYCCYCYVRHSDDVLQHELRNRSKPSSEIRRRPRDTKQKNHGARNLTPFCAYSRLNIDLFLQLPLLLNPSFSMQRHELQSRSLKKH